MKRALSLLLCFGLLAGSASAQSPTLKSADERPLTDTSSDVSLPSWASDAYDRLEKAGVLPYSLYWYGSLSNRAVQRGELAQMLVLALQATVPEEKLKAIPPKEENYFADTNSGLDLALHAAAYGILEGRIGEGGLRYGDFSSNLTRQETAKMICSTLDFFISQGYHAQPTGSPAAYTDADSIASWAAPFTGRIAAYQLMQGDQNGRFNPTGELDWPSAFVLVSRTLSLMEAAQPGVLLDSQMDWSNAFYIPDAQVARPLTGHALGYYTIDNGDGTLSSLTVPPAKTSYATGTYEMIPPTGFCVERYDAQGKVTDSKTLPIELPIFGGFLDGGDYFYLAFGQSNAEESDGKEVYRIVQYDRNWNRVASASVNGGESYTYLPYVATVSRMALSPDGKTLALHAARERYSDGSGTHHQSNITIIVSTDGMKVTSVSDIYPENHVSHSFGQFVQFDGSKMVTVDHGDAYPRSFILQEGSRNQTLLDLYGPVGENKTYAIGSGFEVSDSGYLFLGCSARQDGSANNDTPWNVFLTYTDKNVNNTTFTWLTQGEADIRCARLVKLSGGELLAMWDLGGDVHYQRLDGMGKPVGEEGVLENTPMPTTQPVVSEGVIRWIGVRMIQTVVEYQAAMFELKP